MSLHGVKQNEPPSYVQLYGELEPNDKYCGWEGKEKIRFPVEVKSLIGWSMDCGVSTRGVWVHTKKGGTTVFYKLIQPNETTVTLPDGRMTSQEEVHRVMRAIFGLFSNIADMLFELRPGEGLEVVNYLSVFHCDNTPEESHAALSPSEEQKERHPDLNDEPFDLQLLKRVPCIIRGNIRKLDEKHLTAKKGFYKGLVEMSKVLKEAEMRAEPWTREPFDYLASAKAAEARSKQLPWGDRIPNSLPRPNRLLVLDVPTNHDDLFLQNLGREILGREQMESSVQPKLARSVQQLTEQMHRKSLPALHTSKLSPQLFKACVPVSAFSPSSKEAVKPRMLPLPNAGRKQKQRETINFPSFLASSDDDDHASQSKPSTLSESTDLHSRECPSIADMDNPEEVFDEGIDSCEDSSCIDRGIGSVSSTSRERARNKRRKKAETAYWI
mmetsp:Transcript_18872/g.35054  ORF Transcript_18872/g.35054 Transcript_18872/m.35054 type:complete len:441 (-) Transcript_18872:183-1505(-)